MDEQEIIKAKMEYRLKRAEICAFCILTTVLVLLTIAPILMEHKITTVENVRWGTLGFLVAGFILIAMELQDAKKYYKKL